MQRHNALVTGSNSGIGLAIATALAEAGYGVALNSFTDSAEDHDLAGRLSTRHDVPAVYLSADLTEASRCRELVQEAASRLGRLSVLVNNAGIQHVAPVEDFPPSRWDAVLAVNLSAAFHTTAAAVPAMRQAEWGRVINIASAHGLSASPYKCAYVAAKHGLIGLTRTVALELAESGITCNAICPGYVRTELVESQIAGQMAAHHLDRETVIRSVILERQPSHRFIEAADVASMATYLCSEAAKGITGAALSMDGGWTAR